MDWMLLSSWTMYTMLLECLFQFNCTWNFVLSVTTLLCKARWDEWGWLRSKSVCKYGEFFAWLGHLLKFKELWFWHFHIFRCGSGQLLFLGNKYFRRIHIFQIFSVKSQCNLHVFSSTLHVFCSPLQKSFFIPLLLHYFSWDTLYWSQSSV